MVKTKKKINLHQLDAELNAGGLNMESLDGEHTISAINPEITDEKIENAIKAHVAKDEKQPTIAEKLATVGLSLDELKAALA